MSTRIHRLERRDPLFALAAILGVNLPGASPAFAAFYRVSRPAAALLVPYLAWVSFAAVLSDAIYAASQSLPVRRSRPKERDGDRAAQ